MNHTQLTKHNHILQVNNNSHLQVNHEHSQTITANRYTKNLSEEHHFTQLDRKTQILGSDYKQVVMAEHETIGMIKTIEAGIEIHLKSGLQTVIDGGLSLTLKADGQHIVLNPAGIFTTPIFPGVAPLTGTPAVPIPPMTRQYGVPSTNSPAVKASKAVTTLLNTLLQPAQAQENPPEVIKKIKVIISPLPEMAGYINEPYTLYAKVLLTMKGLYYLIIFQVSKNTT